MSINEKQCQHCTSTEWALTAMGPNHTAFSKIRLTTWLVQSTWWVSLILENAVSFGTFGELSFFLLICELWNGIE